LNIERPKENKTMNLKLENSYVYRRKGQN